MALTWIDKMKRAPPSTLSVVAFMMALLCVCLVFSICLFDNRQSQINNNNNDPGCPYDTITEQEFCGDGEALAAYHGRIAARLCKGEGQ